MGRKECLLLTRKKIGMIFFSFLSNYDHEMREKFFFYYYTSVDTEMCCPKGKCGCQYFILLI